MELAPVEAAPGLEAREQDMEDGIFRHMVEPFEPEDMEPVEEVQVEAEVPEPEAVAPRGPGEASPEEVEQHQLRGHVTPAPWCPHCAAGKGRDGPHTRLEPSESDVPVVEADD